MAKNKTKKIDAILVHAYWYDIDNKDLLDLANKIQVLALKNICNNYDIGNIVITAGQISSGQITIGQELKKEIQTVISKKFYRRILLKSNQKTTIGEVREFRKISLSRDWNVIAALGVSLHMRRIKKGFTKVFKNDTHNITFFEAEKNLNQKELPALKKYKNSKEYLLLELNEQIESAIEGVPVVGNTILEMAGKLSINKGRLQPKIINLIHLISGFNTKSKFKQV